jgi:hypothetical protein
VNDGPRKPVFGFLWPAPDPNAPVDAAYRQVRGVRILPRGPVRIGALVLATALVVIALGSALMAAMTTAVGLVPLLTAAIMATALVAVLRGWVVGTYVNDDGVTIETVLRRTTVSWKDVRAVTVRPAPCPVLGVPVRVTSQRAFVDCADGRTLATHVYATSPDIWLRADAFDMAALRLERWAADQP